MTPVDVHITIRYRDGHETRERSQSIPGWLVTPGLAVHVSHLHAEPPTRWVLTHLPSGLAVSGPSCARHIQQAVDAAIEAGVDWTAGIDVIRDAPAVRWLRGFDRDHLASGHMGCPGGVWTPDGVRRAVR